MKHIESQNLRYEQLERDYVRQSHSLEDAKTCVRSWRALNEANAMLREQLRTKIAAQTIANPSQIPSSWLTTEAASETYLADRKISTPAGILDIGSVTTDLRQQMISNVMDAFKDMMGFELSSSETESDSVSSLTDSTSCLSLEDRNNAEELYDPQDGSEKSSTGSGSRRRSASTSTQHSGQAQNSLKRIRNFSPTDKDSDGHQKRQKPGTPVGGDGKEPKRRFACPYQKRWLDVQPEHQACVFPGFPTIHRVKYAAQLGLCSETNTSDISREHLFRAHAILVQCHNCYQRFDDDAALTQHLSPPSQCPGSGQPSRFAFTIAQERRLRQRVRGISDEQKWRNIYQILFEGDAEALANIPSPCVFPSKL